MKCASVGKIYKWFQCGILCLVLYPAFANPVVKNSRGEKFEVLNITDGSTTHVFDTRNLADKALEQIPKDLRQKAGIETHGGKIEMPSFSPNSIGIGIKSETFLRAFPRLIRLFLSDDSGWYQPGGPIMISNNLMAVLFSKAPHTPKSFTLTFYDEPVDYTKPSAPFASIQIENPLYNTKPASTSPTLPMPLKSGQLELTFRHFITGVDGSEKVGSTSDYRSLFNANHTTDTMQWLAGKVRPARMPQKSYTLMIFDATSSGSKVENLRFQNWYQSIYQQGNTYALLWERNVHSDETTKFMVPTIESPPPDSPVWTHTEPINLEDLTTGIRNLLSLYKDSIELEKTDKPRELKVTLRANDSRVLETIPIMIRDLETSQSVNYTLECNAPFKNRTQEGTIKLDRTTGTIILSFTEGIPRPFDFYAIPDRVK